MKALERTVGIIASVVACVLVASILALFTQSERPSPTIVEVIFWIYGLVVLLFLFLVVSRASSVFKFSSTFPQGNLHLKLVGFILSMIVLPVLVILPLTSYYSRAEVAKFFDNNVERVEDNAILISEMYATEQRDSLGEDMVRLKEEFLRMGIDRAKTASGTVPW